MANTKPRQVTQEELDRAQHMWDEFANATKWSVIATVAVLAILCLVFIV